MGSISGAGGTTTSFGNTPQAKDDSYSYLEDYLLAHSELYNRTSNTLTLDVMANDLGGNAKTLFSIDDGTGNQITDLSQTDLLTDPSRSNWETTAFGQIRIVNGKVEYRLLNPDGTVRDINSLGAGQTISDSFTYAIKLGNGTLSWARVNVELTGSNDGPTANADSASTSENASVTIDAIANDTDPDVGDTLTVTSASAPAGKGATSVIGNQVVFDPGTDFDHLAQGATEKVVISYSISDGHGGISCSTIEITVTGTNDGPVAMADAGATSENASLTLDVLANDTDADDGHVLTVTGASVPAGQGSVSVVDNKVVFDPGTDFDHLAAGTSEQVTVSYGIADEHGAIASSTVTVTVTGTNDTPVAVADTGSGAEDAMILGSVAANDSDIDDGTSLVYATVGAAPAGFSLASDGSWSLDASHAAYQYLPAGTTTDVVVNYTVTDEHGASGAATLTITLTGTNDMPVIAGVSTGEITEDATVPNLATSGVLTIADADAGQSSFAEQAGTPGSSGYGTFTLDGSGNWTYTADDSQVAIQQLGVGETLTDSFTAVSSDGTASQLVTVTIHGTNDAPTSTSGSGTTNEDDAITGTLPVAIDIDGDNVTYALAADAEHGTVVVDASGGFTYTPDADYHGPDSLSFTVSDDHGGSNTYTYDLTIAPLNDLPVAADDVTSTNEDVAITLEAASLLANDTDVDIATDGQVLSITAVSNGAHGSAVLNPDGSITYTPGANYNGTDTITYTVSDGNGGLDTAEVTITVAAVNDAPIAGDGSNSTAEDSALSGTLPAAADVDGDSVTYALAADATNGTVVVNADGTFTYTPDANYNGADSFSFTVSDGHGGANTYEYDLTVTPVNDTPVAVGDSYTTAEDTPLVIAVPGVLGNDSDVDGDTLSSVLVAGPAHGTLTLNADGSFSYTPAPDYNGPDSFTYAPNDGTTTGTPVTVNLTVTPVNDAPIATGGDASGNEDTTIHGQVGATDVDNVAAQLSYILVAPVAGLTFAADGSYSYTPPANFNGSVTFEYQALDGELYSDPKTVTITVAAVNDAPIAGDGSNSTAEDSALSGTLPAGSDADGDGVTYALASAAAHGTVLVNVNGTFTYTPVPNYNGPDSFSFTVSDGHGGSNTYDYDLTVTAVNDAPVISSNGGGATASISISENTTAVTAVAATDIDGPALTYSLAGVDAAKFTIDPVTGALSFVTAADFESPTDVGGNNVYDVIVRASDGAGGIDDQAIAVTVTDVVEGPARFAPTDIKLAPATPSGDVNFNSFAFSAALTAIDPDSGAINFSIQSQTNAGQFSIGAGNQLTATSLGTNATLQIVVRAAQVGDPAGMSLQETFTILTGTNGNSGEVLNGVGGDDALYGNPGTDILYGFGGNDTLFGQDGNDTLDGGDGDDVLNGGSGADMLTGGAGNDVFVLGNTAISSTDTITDYASGDRIDITGVLSVDAATNVISGGFLRVTTTGFVQVDSNGTTGGANWVTLSNVNTGVGPYSITYLSGGVATTVSVSASAPPVALDLDGDGQVSFVSADAGATFDYGGGAVHTAWVAGNDGLLVRDANGDGNVTAAEIVFATTGSDLEGLAVYDSNRDGQLSSADASFAEFDVWQDADGDGEVDSGELGSLSDAGIAAISLNSDGQGYSAADGDVQVVGSGSFIRIDGSSGMLADAVFATRALSEQERLYGGNTVQASLAAAVAASGVATVAVAQALPEPAAGLADVIPPHEQAVALLAPEAPSVPVLAPTVPSDDHASTPEALQGSHVNADTVESVPVVSMMADDAAAFAGIDSTNALAGVDMAPEPLVSAMVSDLAGLHLLEVILDQADVLPTPGMATPADVGAVLADAVQNTGVDAVIDGLVGPTPSAEHPVTPVSDPSVLLAFLDHPMSGSEVFAAMPADLSAADDASQLAAAV